jgi:predicted nucleotidyltransferase
MFEHAVEREGEGAEPAFCAVAGSHVYGFAGPDSDVDVRGVHVVGAERHALLDRPAEQVAVNQDGVTPGFDDVPDVEVVSYELRKFGALVAERTFNALELLFADDPLVAASDAMPPLRRTVEAHLPLDVPRGYVGMARGNYETYLDPARESHRPDATKYLYVLRGLLAARYVLDVGRVEQDLRELAAHGPVDPALVEDLIAVKQADRRPGPDLVARANEAIEGLLADLDPAEDVDAAPLGAAVDEWMLDVRGY